MSSEGFWHGRRNDSDFRAAHSGKLKPIKFGKCAVAPVEGVERVAREGLDPDANLRPPRW